MDMEFMSRLTREALSENRYIFMEYNGRMRNVYPISFRRRLNGMVMYAWCELHPEKLSEAFLLSKIGRAQVSADEAWFKPSASLEIYEGADESRTG